MEAELRALATTTTTEIVWLRLLLANFGVSCDVATPLLCDNTGAIQIANDLVKHELTKHIGVVPSLLGLISNRKLFLSSMCLQNCNLLTFH